MRARISLLSALVVVAGVLLRLRHYLAGRSLWTDEATLALNIATRSFAGLLEPLDYHQTAPVGYLWAARAATSLLGVGELSLRLVPLLAGCALLLVVWRLGERLLGARGGLAALAITAFAPSMIYYSSEGKPYMTDALVAAALLLAALRAIEPGGRGRVALALLGVAAVWCSAPAVFVLAGIGAVMTSAALRSGDRARLGSALATGAAWAASFLAAWITVYRPASGSGYMQEYWEAGFLSFASGDAAARSLKEACRIVWSFFVAPPSTLLAPPLELVVLGSVALVLAGLMLAGMGEVRRERGASAAWLLAAPALVVMAASLARLYPMSTRLLLFAFPAVAVLMTAGLLRVARRLEAPRRDAALVGMTAVIALAGFGGDLRWTAGSVRWTETREVVQAIKADPERSPVYVYARAIAPYAFYSTDWSAPDLGRLERIRAVAEAESGGLEDRDRRELLGRPTGMEWRYGIGVEGQRPSEGWAESEARRIREAVDREVWVLFVHDVEGAERELLPAIEREGGVLRGTSEGRKAVAYRFTFAGE